MSNLPTALTIIKAIALADGRLKGSPRYLTKYQMIRLCKNWLRMCYAADEAFAAEVRADVQARMKSSYFVLPDGSERR